MLFSEPKIPQYTGATLYVGAPSCFSALQRAENSSIYAMPVVSVLSNLFQCSSASRKFLNQYVYYPRQQDFEFQCSSASRKFLNVDRPDTQFFTVECFSALQRAENSSIKPGGRLWAMTATVSVLFSEPKIPQSRVSKVSNKIRQGFSALQRAENSSIKLYRVITVYGEFQCSSASRKFLN